MILGGIGVSIGAAAVNVPQVTYAGLCIIGLGVVSMIWR